MCISVEYPQSKKIQKKFAGRAWTLLMVIWGTCVRVIPTYGTSAVGSGA